MHSNHYLRELSEPPIEQVSLSHYTPTSLGIDDRIPQPSNTMPLETKKPFIQEISPHWEIHHFASKVCFGHTIREEECGEVWSAMLKLKRKVHNRVFLGKTPLSLTELPSARGIDNSNFISTIDFPPLKWGKTQYVFFLVNGNFQKVSFTVL